jgi:hypothetical protein
MKFHKSDADIFVPDGADLPAALERTTHLCIGAHQDDQEFEGKGFDPRFSPSPGRSGASLHF